MNSFLFIQAIVSWLATRQLSLLCSLFEYLPLLLWGEYPLIGRRTGLIARIHALLRRRLCLLIIFRKHTSSIGAPDILRGHSVCKREVLICFPSTQIDLFNEQNNSLNQIYEQIKIIFHKYA